MWIFSPHLFSILGFLLAFALTVRLFREKRPPGSTMAWVLAILLIPYVGVPLYLLFGGRKIRRLAEDKYPLYGGQGRDPQLDLFENDTQRILGVCGAPPPTQTNCVEAVDDGTVAYRRLIEVIEAATESVWVTTFILGRDEVGKNLVDLLARKAKAGVEVKLLVDALGSLKTRGRFCNPLRSAGGKVGIFMPMLPLHRKWSANLRNHRKMVIVDGTTALVGGMNLANQYMGPNADPERFHDFGIILRGPAVADIAKIFCSDWYFATGEMLNPPEPELASGTGDAAIQVVASGPDVYTEPFQQGLLTLVTGAKSRIWFVTPYFIPDEVLARTLALMARLGRDVRVIVPRKSNHLLADLARGSYIRELATAGVKFYGFNPGMLHSKILVVDEDEGVIGSANLDMRSLYLNYEIGLFLRSASEVDKLVRVVEKLQLDSDLIVGQKVAWKGEFKEWIEDASRVLGPLL